MEKIMSIDTKNFGDYTVKKVKSFEGREGYGFNADLYRGKKKVAFCRDMAHGGEVNIDWVEGGWNGEEAKLLKAHVDSLPSVDSKYEGIPPLKIDEGWFVTDCVSKWESEKDLRKMQKQCKTKTLYRHSELGMGSYLIINSPCDDRIRNHLRNKHGEDIEIFNDILARNEIPSVLFNLDITH